MQVCVTSHGYLLLIFVSSTEGEDTEVDTSHSDNYMHTYIFVFNLPWSVCHCFVIVNVLCVFWNAM